MAKNKLTEIRWMECTHPLIMFDHLESLNNQRINAKLRVFIATCCRRIRYLFPNTERGKCLVSIDQWAKELATVRTVETAIQKSLEGWEPEYEEEIVPRENVADALLWILDFEKDPVHAARMVAMHCREAVRASGGSYDDEAQAQVSLLRDFIGNPFQSKQ